MSVRQMSAVCWAAFFVLGAAAVPLMGAVIPSDYALPVAVRAVAIVVVVGMWWGPFVYAMYLSIAVMRNGDRRLLQRGIAGTAKVLTVKRTNTVIEQGEFAWEAPRLYRYRLRVRVPGRESYETTCSICAAGIRVGMVVNVAVSPHNRKRVTIDVGQGGKHGAGVPREAPGAIPEPGAILEPDAILEPGAPLQPDAILEPGATLQPGAFLAPERFAAADARDARDPGPGRPEFTFSRDFPLSLDLPFSPESQRLAALAQLGRLHSQGVLTDAEFAAEKARILAE